MSSDLEYRPRRGDLVPPGGVDLHARDMTATFAADVSLSEAQRRLADVDQWLPVDGNPGLPLGTLVSENSTGPLRLGYGAWRDLLLGVQFTSGRGALITAGGRTVKNVAGYDLTKFMVGQRGVFGRIVTLTTRTYRRPAGAVLARYRPEHSILSNLLPAPLRPQWAVLTGEELLCGFLADAATLDWYEANLNSSEPVSVYRRSVDVDAEHRQSLWRDATGAPDGDAILFRASVPPSRVRAFVDAARPLRWAADAAFGIVVGAAVSPNDAQSVRSAAASLAGSVTFRSAGTAHAGAAPAILPVESTNDVERRIIERLKAAFDPDGTLSPLPWQSR